MFEQHEKFAVNLVADVLASQAGLQSDPDHPCKVLGPYPGGDWAALDLTPFAAELQAVDAEPYFVGVQTAEELLDAYYQAKQAKPFEDDLLHAYDYVSDYAAEFLDGILTRARSNLKDEDARRIAGLVSHLDIYAAVKSVESLLNSRADLALLKIAELRGWNLHFDHLAIRCGCSEHGDAERVVENLRRFHGYVPCQVRGEDYYQFEDGWDAYVLYKMLDNGQQLRMFIDQSTVGNTTQIIQHWNHVYGYTAHHLAIRVTRVADGKRIAVSLAELAAAIEKDGFEAMTPTGQYTDGLLEQVFTRPERNPEIPDPIRQRLRRFDTSLEATIENGKLLELLSRREMSNDLKPAYFGLYGIPFDNTNPLHSAPVYPYFLPAQAAHVIRTSVQVA